MRKLYQSLLKSAQIYATQKRLASTQSFLNVSPKENYSVLELQKKPVNSLSLEMCEEVIKSLDTLEKDKSIKGLIITSSLPVFSAGLDLMEMYQPKVERLSLFWKAVQEMTLRLYSSPLVLISAINGACPAGGCIFAFSSDYRVIAEGKHRMGLNEVHLGIAAPFFLCDALVAFVGQRRAEEMLCLGQMCTPDEALKIGLVDKVTAAENLLTDAENQMKKYLQIPQIGRIKSKQLVRRHFVEEFAAKREADFQTFCQMIPSDPVQKTLHNYVEALKKK